MNNKNSEQPALRNRGTVGRSNRARFSRDALAHADILVIVNAMHEQSEFEFAPLPSLSAFSDAEIQAVEHSVSEGGSLLLIADHMPLSGHASELAAAFGVLFHNGFAYEDADRESRITFSRTDGSLTSTIIATGRNANERVDFVTTFTGQAFRLDPTIDAEPLLVLPKGSILLVPEVAWEFSESTPRIPADYLLQGAIVRHGRRRVAVFGEAAMFGARLAGPDLIPIGMNAPEARWNQRFAINVMRWLSGVLQPWSVSSKCAYLAGPPKILEFSPWYLEILDVDSRFVCEPECSSKFVACRKPDERLGDVGRFQSRYGNRPGPQAQSSR